MRRLFFERELEDLNLQLMADPAERLVLALPLDASRPFAPERIGEALERVALAGLVAEPGLWEQHESLVALPWRS